MASNVPLKGSSDAAEQGRAAMSVESPRAPASPRSAAVADLMTKFGLLGFFTMSRALHPLIIDKTKENGKYPHEPVTIVFVSSIVIFVFMQVVCLIQGGLAQWKQIWERKPMVVFSLIGFVYGVGDWLELKSLGGLSGTMYQVLSQSKLLITAAMMWGLKGQKQSPLQWILLVLLMLSLCCYSIMSDLLDQYRALSESREIKESKNTVFGMIMAILKVFVSCLAAVLSDKYMKEYKSEPIYMQLVQLRVVWTITLTVIMFAEGDPIGNGLFYNWKVVTFAALVSFTVKSVSTMYLVAIMDALSKNIGEALSVLVIYFISVFHASFDDEYENETFITIMVVFLSVVAYMASKDVASKAEKWDNYRATTGGVH